MGKNQSKRKQLVVLSHFQKWFLTVFVGYTAMFLMVFGIGLYLWFHVLLGELLNLAGLLSETFLSTIQRHITLGLWVTIAFIIGLSVIAGLQALFFSRRIAGPIFSLSQHLEKCEKKGKWEPWQIRKGDLFVDLVGQFNSVAEKLNGKQ